MNSLERDHSDFMGNSELHRQPMQCKQQWGDMTLSGFMGNKSRSRILKTL